MRHIWLAQRFITALYLMGSLLTVSLAIEQPNLVIVDNDFNGPPWSLTNQRAALMFLESSEVKVLGFTVVTGDGWRDEEVCHLLRLLEIAGRPDIPVVPGAVFPLVNTQARAERFKPLAYRGAWDTAVTRGDPSYVPHGPEVIPAFPEGMPKIKPSSDRAATFMIEQVHAHPHQVSIFAGGPLTNLALAVRLDPDFPRLAKELVFAGAFLNLGYADFNVGFDPEAAQIVLSAPWPTVTVVADVSGDAKFSGEDSDQITAARTAISKYVIDYSRLDRSKDWPLWDELAAAILIDPTIAKSDDTWLSINLDHGEDYGLVHVCNDQDVPASEKSKVRMVKSVDLKSFKARFVKCMSAVPATP
jgi:inosine-uridine nucleoside N-ribohydrolase